ncbi:WD40 domain-containing protein [Thecamonas trahens ATCC 50062]|uniref:WD40 domain-containing protein n=1 Tax=Thecamonas trahens ATCC 50062 TaxID=461836 RepID=A0A0L0D2N2_THETB|nr:WD40 domain-containing protein [Thecamonas trahens ATCC 50062]KNC46466.1 WD40 domain-containing protein [Thecamonas trahens ATCC 50062]|eukprot:XP_013752610.1 WD40 domain-containing protein [Thecamonas trahens ATCC 50062]
MLSLRDKLVALGLRVFLDVKSLDAMIVQDPADCARLARDSHVVVVVVSKYSIVTRWAIAEADAALADPTCKVFPVFADAELSLETVSSPAWRDGPRDASHPLLAYMAAAFPPQIPNNRRFTDLWEHDELTPELKVARIGTLYALLERGLAPYSPARDSVVDMVDDLADRIQAIVPTGANHAAVAVALSWPWMNARANDSLGGLLNDLRCVVRLGREGAKDVDQVEHALSLSREIIESGTSHIETELVARLAYDNASNAVKDLVAAVSKDAPSGALIPLRVVDPVAHRGAERFRFDGLSGNVINIGGSLVAAGCGKNVDVLDVQTGERVEVLEGHTSDVRGVIALPSADGQLPVLVSWSRDRTIRVWHAADDGMGAMRYTADSASCEVLEGHTKYVRGVIALPSAHGQLPVLVSWSWEDTIRVWHAADNGTGAMRADGQLPVLVSWSRDNTIRVWHAAYDGTGAMRYTADSASCEVLESHTDDVEGVIALPSADGQLPVLVSWSWDSTIRVWHAADDGTGAMRYTADRDSCEVLEGHTSGVEGVIALPSTDGQLPVLVSWSRDRTIRVWHAADDGMGAMRYTADSASCEVLEGHTDDVHGVIALPSADGQLPVLVSWSWEDTIRVWHAADDEMVCGV